jgi:predicted N-acyltransferase
MKGSMALEVEVVSRLSEIGAPEWDALAGDDDPFIEHAFLLALEESGSVGGKSGWLPVHIVVRERGRLVAALPLYVKLHSYGEYIFDWSWAGAAERAGIAYYPKLVSMVPFTPATGRHLLLASDRDARELASALLAGVASVQKEASASSVHFLFLSDQERALLAECSSDLMPRLSSQFHWRNDGYQSFDDFLSRFRSALRKQVRRERRQAAESGFEIRVLEGPELGPREWEALSRFYRDTCYRRGSGPYLTPRFFDELRERHARRVVAVFAHKGAEPVAARCHRNRQV